MRNAASWLCRTKMRPANCIWQLAKSYHSSEEAIIGLNGADCAENGALLLIPKTK